MAPPPISESLWSATLRVVSREQVIESMGAAQILALWPDLPPDWKMHLWHKELAEENVDDVELDFLRLYRVWATHLNTDSDLSVSIVDVLRLVPRTGGKILEYCSQWTRPGINCRLTFRNRDVLSIAFGREFPSCSSLLHDLWDRWTPKERGIALLVWLKRRTSVHNHASELEHFRGSTEVVWPQGFLQEIITHRELVTVLVRDPKLTTSPTQEDLHILTRHDHEEDITVWLQRLPDFRLPPGFLPWLRTVRYARLLAARSEDPEAMRRAWWDKHTKRFQAPLDVGLVAWACTGPTGRRAISNDRIDALLHFVAAHHLQVKILLLNELWCRQDWARYDACIKCDLRKKPLELKIWLVAHQRQTPDFGPVGPHRLPSYHRLAELRLCQVLHRRCRTMPDKTVQQWQPIIDLLHEGAERWRQILSASLRWSTAPRSGLIQRWAALLHPGEDCDDDDTSAWKRARLEV